MACKKFKENLNNPKKTLTKIWGNQYAIDWVTWKEILDECPFCGAKVNKNGCTKED